MGLWRLEEEKISADENNQSLCLFPSLPASFKHLQHSLKVVFGFQNARAAQANDDASMVVFCRRSRNLVTMGMVLKKICSTYTFTSTHSAFSFRSLQCGQFLQGRIQFQCLCSQDLLTKELEDDETCDATNFPLLLFRPFHPVLCQHFQGQIRRTS